MRNRDLIAELYINNSHWELPLLQLNQTAYPCFLKSHASFSSIRKASSLVIALRFISLYKLGRKYIPYLKTMAAARLCPFLFRYPVLCCVKRSAGVLLVMPTYRHCSTPLNCGFAFLNRAFSVKTRFDNSITYTWYLTYANEFLI